MNDDKGFARLKTAEKVYFPDGLMSIDPGCFWDFEKLKEAHIPANTELGKYAFGECPELVIYAHPLEARRRNMLKQTTFFL